MDKERRDKLRTVIGEVRRLVEESLKSQLVSYGLYTDIAPLPREQLLHLTPDKEPHYRQVLDAVRREGRAVDASDQITPQAVARFVREAGGTWVNRLAALRALEARDLLGPPAAFVSDEYGGLSPRAQRLRQQSAQQGRSLTPDEALQTGIEDACRELSENVRVLFDLGDEHSLLWPDSAALRNALRKFSSEVTDEDWRQPDVLGWVYQYYNTETNAELKRRKNRTTGFKYRPDDIPVANQFYTPHWVVRVLTDNTLGRLWLEMQDRLPQLERSEATEDGRTVERYRLVERRHDVPHAAEDPAAFRQWINKEPDPLAPRECVDRLCSFLVPLPSRALPRAPKSVRDIRVLDPACGSGHFLLYAFDILFAMYREAESDLDPREIPALILGHNLYGIDIDLRAAQLAAFALYLKARTTLAAIDPKAPLLLRGLNIVIADAHIDDDPRKAEFLDRYRHDPEVQELYRKVLSDLDHTNALGSLIKVRTEFETLFGRIRRSREQARKAAEDGLSRAQAALFETAAQLELRDTYRSASGRTWTIRELLDELRTFEGEVAPSQDIGARLFYVDLERTVGLLGLLSEQYDVVLTNPPYGDMPPETKDYLTGNKKKGIEAHYPRTHQDLATAFIEQSLDLLHENGFLGGLVPRSFMYLSSFEEMRRHILTEDSGPELLQEYGLGILDGATVRTVGAVIRKTRHSDSSHPVTFQRLAYHPTVIKPQRFLETLSAFAGSGPVPEIDWFIARLRSLQDVPGAPYAYWASDSLRALFRRFPVLDIDKVLSPAGLSGWELGEVKQGIATQDDTRFTRYWWEITSQRSLIPQGWRWYAKGGSNVFFYGRIDLLVDWREDGKAIKDWIRNGLGDHPTRHLRNLDYQGRAGLTWRAVAWTTRRFGYVPTGAMFSNRGSMVFAPDATLLPLLGFLNSSLASVLVLCQTVEREWHLSEIAALPISGRLSETPIECVEGLLALERARHAGDETCRDFGVPDLLGLWRNSRGAETVGLARLLQSFSERSKSNAARENLLLSQLDERVYQTYELAPEDRKLVERELSRRPKAEGGYSADELMATGPDADMEIEEDDVEQPEADGDLEEAGRAEGRSGVITPGVARDLVARWTSYYLKQLIEADEDGIVPLEAIHGEPALVIRLREAMERDLGSETARMLEQQAPGYLGVKDLAEWLAVSREETVDNDGKAQRAPVGFFPWHVGFYRNRPIFWLLSSENFEPGRTRLTFRAYLHYLKLTPDTLPRLVSYYLDPTIDVAEREWKIALDGATKAEGKGKTSAKAVADEWANTVTALKKFRSSLEDVIQGPPHAQKLPASAKWLPRTIAEVRGGKDAGHGYRPDIDHGVRVNITPLVEQKLLPRVVLKRLGG